jgi:hypothetical protein
MMQADLTQRSLARRCDRAKIAVDAVIAAWRDIGAPLVLSADKTRAVVDLLLADGLLQPVTPDRRDVRLTVAGVRRGRAIQHGNVEGRWSMGTTQGQQAQGTPRID